MLKAIACAFAMTDDVWRRHANPWSGWTRMVTGLPLIALAVWSRVWIGWWALAAFGAVVLWLWLNPRAFPPPASTDAWVSRAVMGEKVLIEHRDAIPAHHRLAATRLAWASLPGTLIFLWALYALRLDWLVFGGVLALLPKLWFLDRMVWLLADWQRAGGRVWADD